MASQSTQALVGALVLALAVGFFAYAGRVAGLAPGRERVAYRASFRSVEGVSVGTDVRLAGVKIGVIEDIRLDPESFRAVTRLGIDRAVPLPEDSAAIISTEGLLGDAFVEILPGGSSENLAPGDEIEDTQSAISIVNLLMKFVTGGSEGAGQ